MITKENKMRFFNAIIILLMLSAVSAFALDENATGLNITSNDSLSDENAIPPFPDDNIVETPEEVSDFAITNVVPNEFNAGDIQFNIQVQNNGTVELKNLAAVISGKGFSTYDVVQIDSLKAGEKSYIIVMGNEKSFGNITLTIKINEKTFLRNIIISNPDAVDTSKNLEDTKKAEEANKKELSNLSAQLDDLNKKYKTLEDELQTKKSNDYDVSNVDLEDLKNFLRDAQSAIIQEDIRKSRVGVSLATNEYNDQKDHLDSAQIIKRSISGLLKDNAVLISTLAGSIIAFFSLWELLKKKKEHLYQKIKEVQINKDTKVIVEKKRSKKGKKEEDEE